MKTFIALYVRLEMPSCNRKELFFRGTRKTIYEIHIYYNILFESISQLREHFNVTTTIATERNDSDDIIIEIKTKK